MTVHGGKRNGSGRKPGSQTRKTAEIAVQAAAEGITPIQVILKAMRAADSKGDMAAAAGFAQMAAPYIHPRLSAIAHTGGDGGPMQIALVEEIVDADGEAHGNPDDPASPDSGDVSAE